MTNHVLARCRRILQFCEESQPRKGCVKPVSPAATRTQLLASKHLSPSLHNRSPSFHRRSLTSQQQFSFTQCKTNQTSIHKESVSSVRRLSKESRLDKIMRLKVKPAHKRTQSKQGREDSIGSMHSSIKSIRSNAKSIKKTTRFQRIMQLKITKPRVGSTLKHYKPKHEKKMLQLKEINNSCELKEWLECRKSFKQAQLHQEKQNRLWKEFERQRLIHSKERKASAEKAETNQRRKEIRFDLAVAKELNKIERKQYLQ